MDAKLWELGEGYDTQPWGPHESARVIANVLGPCPLLFPSHCPAQTCLQPRRQLTLPGFSSDSDSLVWAQGHLSARKANVGTRDISPVMILNVGTQAALGRPRRGGAGVTLTSHKLGQMLALGCTLSPHVFHEHLKWSGSPGLLQLGHHGARPQAEPTHPPTKREVENSHMTCFSPLSRPGGCRPPFAEEKTEQARWPLPLPGPVLSTWWRSSNPHNSSGREF